MRLTQTISLDDLEDLVFGEMLNKAKTGETVPREEVLKPLNVK